MARGRVMWKYRKQILFGIYEVFLQRVLWMFPPKLAHSIIYWYHHNDEKIINWKKPELYDEKIHWIIAKRLGPKHAIYADKFLVRGYVEESGFKELLVPLLGKWDCVEDINFDELVYPCIFKTNNGSGPLCYCKMYKNTKKERDRVISMMKVALKKKIYRIGCEYHYKYIKPAIICEKLLGETDEVLTDYKLVCSRGEVGAVLVCQNRNKGRDYYTLDWKHTNYTREEKQSGFIIPRPQGLDIMIRAAEELSKSFELARIDFYDIDGEVYFGEITLTPSGGNHKYLSEEGKRALGAFVKL